MNSQQLKDLAEQAGFITFAGPDIQAPEDPYSDGCAAQLAKFAELILEEVMQELFINGHEDAFDFLNKHFGVEE